MHTSITSKRGSITRRAQSGPDLRIVWVFCIAAVALLVLASPKVVRAGDEDAWSKLIKLAEAIVGDGGLMDAEGAEAKIDAVVDLHAEFCRDVLGKPVPFAASLGRQTGVPAFSEDRG